MPGHDFLRAADRSQVDAGIPFCQEIDVRQGISDLLVAEFGERTEQRRNLINLHS